MNVLAASGNSLQRDREMIHNLSRSKYPFQIRMCGYVLCLRNEVKD